MLKKETATSPVPPIPTFPALSIRIRSVPPVVNPSVSAAGKKMPVFVSPVVVRPGSAAVPAAKVDTPVTPRVVLAVNEVKAPVVAVVAPTVPLMLIDAVPVRLVTVPLAGVPRIGVTRVGDVANTAAPVPVSSVKAVSNCSEVNEPKDAAFPTDVTAPVRLAFVVTLDAVNAVAVPVMFVPTNALGVPRAGVIKVGEVLNTKLVEVVPVAPAAV